MFSLLDCYNKSMETLNCGQCRGQFMVDADDIQFYSSIDIDCPKLCPECRYQRRIANRNEWSLYKQTCSLCNKNIVSIYNSDYVGPVYCPSCFWSDNWEPRDYARDFDFTRPFFEQFKELRFSVPRLAITNSESVNSEYTNQAQANKDCYLIVASNESENCMYGNWYQNSKNCTDCYMAEKCDLLYECMNCANCFGSSFLQNCSDCHSSHFLKDCRGCSECFGCVGLRNKQNHWFNEEVSKDEYKKRFAAFLWTRENINYARARVRDLDLSLPHKYYEGRNNVNSTGDYLEHTKNVSNSFNCRHAEDIRHCQDAWKSKESMDVTEVFSEFTYEAEGVICRRSMALSRAWDVYDCYYSELCFNSNDLFGCMGLNKKQYCIFNKEYPKEEYLALKERIIAHMKQTGEWGEFFPIEISPFAYNESVAQEYFPLNKGGVEGKGWKWHEREERGYQPTMRPENLPSSISETPDSITSEIIQCVNQCFEEEKKSHMNCATAFRVTPSELEFYRRINVPIPNKCFPCRRQNRFFRRNPRKLWNRQCECGGVASKNGKYQNVIAHFHGKEPDNGELETTYAPERKEIIYCESCYQAETS